MDAYEKMREAQRRYEASPKGLAAIGKYAASPKGTAARRRARLKYQAGPKYALTKLKYREGPKYAAVKERYKQRLREKYHAKKKEMNDAVDFGKEQGGSQLQHQGAAPGQNFRQN